VSSAALAPTDELLVDFVEDEARIREVIDRALAEFDRDQPEIWADLELRELGARAIAAAMAQFGAVVRGSLSVEELSLPPANAELAIAQVRRGVTIEQALHSAGLAQAASWDIWLREAQASSIDPSQLAAAIARIATEMLRVGNSLCQEISKVHAAERERWLGGQSARQARAVMSLLASADGGENPRRLSADLGYELGGVHRAVITWSAPASRDGTAQLHARLARDLIGARGLLIEVEAHAAWAWCSPALTADPRAICPAGVKVAIGGAHAGAAGFRRSHREAQLARQLAGAMSKPLDVVSYEDVALLAIAAQDIDYARGFVQEMLEPLFAAGSRGALLARTIKVYLEEQSSPRRAAHRLALHENTVIKHVRAAEEMLGRSVEDRHPELLVALMLAECLELDAVTRTARAPRRRG
jgi:hypothetical protein